MQRYHATSVQSFAALPTIFQDRDRRARELPALLARALVGDGRHLLRRAVTRNGRGAVTHNGEVSATR